MVDDGRSWWVDVGTGPPQNHPVLPAGPLVPRRGPAGPGLRPPAESAAAAAPHRLLRPPPGGLPEAAVGPTAAPRDPGQQVPEPGRGHGGHGRERPHPQLRGGGGLRQQRVPGLRLLLAPPHRGPPHAAGHPPDEGPPARPRGQEDQARYLLPGSHPLPGQRLPPSSAELRRRSRPPGQAQGDAPLHPVHGGHAAAAREPAGRHLGGPGQRRSPGVRLPVLALPRRGHLWEAGRRVRVDRHQLRAGPLRSRRRGRRHRGGDGGRAGPAASQQAAHRGHHGHGRGFAADRLRGAGRHRLQLAAGGGGGQGRPGRVQPGLPGGAHAARLPRLRHHLPGLRREHGAAALRGAAAQRHASRRGDGAEPGHALPGPMPAGGAAGRRCQGQPHPAPAGPGRLEPLPAGRPAPPGPPQRQHVAGRRLPGAHQLRRQRVLRLLRVLLLLRGRAAAGRPLPQPHLRQGRRGLLRHPVGDPRTAAGKQAVLSARRPGQGQEAVLQVGLDVRRAALGLPLPRRLRRPDHRPAGLRQGGAVDPRGHPVQDPLPAAQGPAAGGAAAEPPRLAALLLRPPPPPAVPLHPGGAAGHPAPRPAPAEDPPAGAAPGRGPEPALGGGGRGAAPLRAGGRIRAAARGGVFDLTRGPLLTGPGSCDLQASGTNGPAPV